MGHATRTLQAVMLKHSAVAWGGQKWQTGTAPIGLEAGYDWLLGTVPIPSVGLRIGSKDEALTIGGPIPSIGYTSVPAFKGRAGTGQRNVWDWMTDDREGDEIFEDRLNKLDADDREGIENLLRDYGIDPESEHGVDFWVGILRRKSRGGTTKAER